MSFRTVQTSETGIQNCAYTLQELGINLLWLRARPAPQESLLQSVVVVSSVEAESPLCWAAWASSSRWCCQLPGRVSLLESPGNIERSESVSIGDYGAELNP